MFISKENYQKNVEYHDFYDFELHIYNILYLHNLNIHIQDFKAGAIYSFGSLRINNIYFIDLTEHFLSIHKLNHNFYYLILLIYSHLRNTFF